MKDLATARSSLDLQVDMELDSLPSSSYPSSLADFNLNKLLVPADLGSSLPPIDGGKDAWLFLAAGTVIEALTWGTPASIGVLHEYWTSELFPIGTDGRELLTVAATLQVRKSLENRLQVDANSFRVQKKTGLLYCTPLFFTPLFARYPHHRSKLQLLGLIAAVCALTGAGFATKPIHLVVTLGMVYPLAGLFYLPAANLLFVWFFEKRGLASGLMFSGTGVGGTAFPFIMQSLISKFGYRSAMISLGVGYLLLGLLVLPFIKPRIPTPARNSPDAIRSRKIDRNFLKHTPFYAFTGAILLTSLSNFVPSVWIPSFAADLNLPRETGTILVAVMSASSIPGLLILGILSDRWPIRAVILLSCCGSSLACLFLWGFSKHVELLTIFAIVFGSLGLSFTAVWSKLVTIVATDDPALPPVIMSLFALARGIANVSSGPIATALLATSTLSGSAGGYGVKNYGPLLLYSGLTMAAGSIIGISYRDGLPKKRSA